MSDKIIVFPIPFTLPDISRVYDALDSDQFVDAARRLSFVDQ